MISPKIPLQILAILGLTTAFWLLYCLPAARTAATGIQVINGLS